MLKKIEKTKSLDPSRFGIDSASQWLLVSPIRYEDYSIVINNYSALEAGMTYVISGKIVKKVLYCGKQESKNFKTADRIAITLEDQDGNLLAVNAFGRPGFEWQPYNINAQVIVRGQLKEFNGQLTLQGKIVDKKLLGRIVPIYGQIKNTAGARLSEMVDQNVDYIDVAGEIIESETGWNESEIRNHNIFQRYKSAQDLIEELHDPLTIQGGRFALKSAAFLSAYALIRKAKMRAAVREPNTKSIVLIPQGGIDSCLRRLPFSVTGDQLRAVQGIASELRSPYPLDGILSGDVGSGKTATFLIPLVAAHEAGARCVIMAPNLLLIKQIAKEIKTYFPTISVCTITGGKDGIVGNPEGSILVGTTALVSWFRKHKDFGRPHLLVIDEQQRFSVEQRSSIAANFTNILEATATPIPRTAALAIYGDKSLFLLKEIPVKKRIETIIVSPEDNSTIDNLVKDILRDTNEQIAIVYPLVSSTDEKNQDISVINAAQIWGTKIDPSLITVLHGKMTDDEKVAAIEEFKAGKTKLLIASTVIEVGLTVPELKTLMVVGAEKMGLVTLHQLRGRLARHGGEGLMLLYVEDLESESIERLQILVDHFDGFTVSEKDAEQRGFGDFLSIDGDAQSGKTKTLFLGVKIGPKEIDSVSRAIEELTPKSPIKPRIL